MKSLYFFEKRRLDFFYLGILSLFYFLYMKKNLCNSLHLEKLGFYSFFGVYGIDFGRDKCGLSEHMVMLLRIQE